MRNLRYLRLQWLVRTLLTVGLVTLLLIDAFVLQNHNEADKTKDVVTAAKMNNSDSNQSFGIHAKELQQELEDGSGHDGDLSHLASKRKVPRGPDPIHNRRAGKSRRPRGRA